MKDFIELYKSDKFVRVYTKELMRNIDKGYYNIAMIDFKTLKGALTYIAWNNHKISYDEVEEFTIVVERWIKYKTGLIYVELDKLV